MFIPSFLMPDSWIKAQQRRERDLMESHRDWQDFTNETKWQPWLGLRAKTYPVLNLFPKVKPHKLCHHEQLPVDCKTLSPTGKFLYRNTILPKYHPIGIYRKRGTNRDVEKGSVFFDGPVILPSLFEVERLSRDAAPWMSLSPNEIMTLRPGTRRAKGRVVIAGLGLGHQLIEVSKRKQVKSITLVEISEELVAWLMPRIRPHLNGAKVDVIIGDAWKVLPKLTADVALVDVFPGFGHNREHWHLLECQKQAKNIKSWWIWG